MNSTTLERERSSEPAKPPPKRTVADSLRRLADWIERHEVTDDGIVTAGIDLIHIGPQITLRGHELFAEVFAGRTVTAVRNANFDELRLLSDGIHFSAWKSRQDVPPRESAVTL